MKRQALRANTASLSMAWDSGIRHPLVMALALAMALVLIPVGAQAIQVVNAIITDPGGINQATVDPTGDLHVAASDGSGKAAFTFGAAMPSMPPGNLATNRAIAIPPGKRLVITHISGSAQLPAGQSVALVQLLVSTDMGNAVHYFVPTRSAASATAVRYLFSQDTTIYADDEIKVYVVRSASADGASADVAVSGYLIDCSAATCT